MSSEQTLVIELYEKMRQWFAIHARKGLPWRKEPRDPYAVWVSEIMLQQTQVQRVIPFYTRFLARFPDIPTLAAASWEEFLPYYQGLGYYSRGRNMLHTAQILQQQYGGAFPQTVAELTALPGIGVYTAHALLSFGFDKPFVSFDTNHRKVWGRVLYGHKKAVLDEEKITQTLIHHASPKTPFSAKILNEALMDFANTLCLNTNPLCPQCPLQAQCMYAQQKGKQEEKSRSEKRDFPTKEAQVFLFLHAKNTIFFSPSHTQLQPFVLPSEYNSRAGIKAYFLQKYGLTLAVRPPFQKRMEKGKPTLFVKAQILLGEHHFTSFPKQAFQTSLESV